MGNCHTVGPNEALVVSGNVKPFWTMCFHDLKPFLLVELDAARTGRSLGEKLFTSPYTFMISNCSSCMF